MDAKALQATEAFTRLCTDILHALEQVRETKTYYYLQKNSYRILAMMNSLKDKYLIFVDISALKTSESIPKYYMRLLSKFVLSELTKAKEKYNVEVAYFKNNGHFLLISLRNAA